MEPQQTRIEPGVVVEASDGHGRLGTVDDVVVWPDTGEIAYLVGRRGWTDAQFLGPRKLIDSVPSLQEVRLRVRRDDVGEVAAAVPIEGCLAHQRGEELRIPVAEERLIPRQRWVDMGEQRLHLRVEERAERITQSGSTAWRLSAPRRARCAISSAHTLVRWVAGEGG